MLCIGCSRWRDNFESHKLVCQPFKDYSTLDVLRSQLIDLISTQGCSILEVEEIINQHTDTFIKHGKIRRWCRKNGIQIKPVQEINRSARTVKRRAESFKSKYGVDNPSQLEVVKDRKKQTNLERYGVENPWHRPEIREKAKATLMRNYGVSSARHIPRIGPCATSLTRPHKKISRILENHNIIHENEKYNLFPKPKSSNNRIYSPIVDIWIPDYNAVIEIYGDRWHANPRIYRPTDVLPLFIGDTTAEDIWRLNKTREDHIKSFGVEFLVIWELDINEDYVNVEKNLVSWLQNISKKG